jgi:hypothetical protein
MHNSAYYFCLKPSPDARFVRLKNLPAWFDNSEFQDQLYPKQYKLMVNKKAYLIHFLYFFLYRKLPLFDSYQQPVGHYFKEILFHFML